MVQGVDRGPEVLGKGSLMRSARELVAVHPVPDRAPGNLQLVRHVLLAKTLGLHLPEQQLSKSWRRSIRRHRPMSTFRRPLASSKVYEKFTTTCVNSDLICHEPDTLDRSRRASAGR